MTRPTDKEIKRHRRRGRRAGRAGSRHAHRQFPRAGVRRFCGDRRHAALRSRAVDVCRRANRKGRPNEHRAGPDVVDGGCPGDRREALFLARSDAILSRPDRAMAASPECLHRDRGGRGAEGGRRCRCSACEGQRRGALHGVPLAHKDMYYEAGKVVTCGSRIRRDFVATTTVDGRATPQGRRHDPPRLVADGRVRLRPDRPQRAFRPGA